MNIARQFIPHHFEQTILNDQNHLGSVSLINIRDFFGRQWRLIAVITGLCIVIGAIYVALSPTKYTAQADMIIDTKRVTWTQSDMSTENRTVDDASVESEIETTKSEKVAMAVINRLHLTDNSEFVGNGTGILRRIFFFARSEKSIEP